MKRDLALAEVLAEASNRGVVASAPDGLITAETVRETFSDAVLSVIAEALDRASVGDDLNVKWGDDDERDLPELPPFLTATEGEACLPEYCYPMTDGWRVIVWKGCVTVDCPNSGGPVVLW